MRDPEKTFCKNADWMKVDNQLKTWKMFEDQTDNNPAWIDYNDMMHSVMTTTAPRRTRGLATLGRSIVFKRPYKIIITAT